MRSNIEIIAKAILMLIMFGSVTIIGAMVLEAVTTR